jgi:hypothetical protein
VEEGLPGRGALVGRRVGIEGVVEFEVGEEVFGTVGPAFQESFAAARMAKVVLAGVTEQALGAEIRRRLVRGPNLEGAGQPVGGRGVPACGSSVRATSGPVRKETRKRQTPTSSGVK